MTRRSLLILLLLLFCYGLPIHVQGQQPQAGTPTPPGTSQPDSAAPARYDALIERLKAGDKTIDFTELRLAFTETPASRGVLAPFHPMLWKPLNSKDFEGTLKVAERVLLQCYIEPNAHMVSAIAHEQLGNREQAQYHRFIANGLLRSILSKGDGKTAETAYEVIDIIEEYAVFHSMNLAPRSQAA